MQKTVLIVDDSEVMRWTMTSTLKRNGYDVLTAKDGLDALEKIKDREKIHLIITDVHMPGMDGLSFIAEIRKREGYKFTPIIVLTTEIKDEMKQEGRKAGATGWIVKPFRPENLLDTVRKICPN